MESKGCGRTVGKMPCCTVILGDCNDYLGQISPGEIDLVVTDPPYGMNYVSNMRREKHRAIAGDGAYPEETVKKLLSLPRLAAYFFCRWDNLWEHGTLPKPASVITWTKGGGFIGDVHHEHGRTSENILYYPGTEHAFKKRPSDVVKRPSDVVACPKEDCTIHPTQKPVWLIKQMLEWYDFETVLDPYMGYGTTGRAALSLGKHFIGFEIDPKYHCIACEVTQSKSRGPSIGQDVPDATFLESWNTAEDK